MSKSVFFGMNTFGVISKIPAQAHRFIFGILRQQNVQNIDLTAAKAIKILKIVQNYAS